MSHAHSGSTPSPFWSPGLEALHPYVPGEQPRTPPRAKLNTNENPYPPSPRAVAAMRAVLDQSQADALRLYPDPTSLALRSALARESGLAADQVFVGNGSDEVLAFAFQGLFRHPGRPLAFPEVSYSFYPVYCGLYGIESMTLPMRAEGERGEALVFDLDAVPRHACGLIFPNPNAPTSIAKPRQEIERLLQARPELLVLVDEAYVDFGAQSCVPLIHDHPNLLVSQSFSKSRGLAGLRLGMAFGQAPLIEALVRVKDSVNSYPIDRLALAGGTAAVEDRAHFEQTRDAIVRDRGALRSGLLALGFAVAEPAGNFVFAKAPVGQDALGLAQALRTQGILVRHFNTPMLRDFLRITVGRAEENALLLEALRALLAAQPEVGRQGVGL